MPTQLDSRQVVLRAAQAMLGSAANDALNTIFPKIDAEMAKLFEDRNVLLTDGGIITFTGTQIQFTEALNLVINQKISGAAPQVITLGSANVDLLNGEMWYAVVDRTAGTATTAVASTLPAVTSANQEVFLIVKRVDAGDGTQRIYWRTGMAMNAGQSNRLGASGSGGSGSGVGDDLGTLLFKASFTDGFDEGPTDTKSAVNTSAGFTDPTAYNAAKAMYTLNYDASKTIAAGTTTTNINLSANADFTVKIGDIVVNNGQARRITAVANQASFTTEAFTTAPTLASQVTVSQAIYSKDLNNFAVDGLPISSAFSTSINQILVTYEDTTAAGDNIFDANTVAVVGFSASSDNTNFTSVQIRPQFLNDTQLVKNLPTSSTSLYMRFFANKTSGSGTVNLLGYKTFLHKFQGAEDGTILNQAYARTDNSGTKINVSAVTVVGNKTRITTSWAYPVAVNSGTPNGSIKVYVNGQKMPRYVDATVSVSGYYTEIDQNTIELDANYSYYNYEVEIIQDVAVVDASDTNTTNVASLQEISTEGFQSFMKTSAVLAATSAIGTPATGTFHSTVQNRASITDLTQDGKVRMGIDRYPLQNLFLLQNEFGPAQEQVWAPVNDSNNLVRMVGSWTYAIGSDGNRLFTGANTTDYIEITFFGTGLNLLGTRNDARNVAVSVDGGSETTINNFWGSNAVITVQNRATNVPAVVASGLTLGIHTVKIRNNASSAVQISGYEVVTDVTSLRVNPGSAYIAGKKTSNSSLQTVAYNSSFETGTLGTRGGRVIVYMKADGSIAKAVQPVDAAQANLSSASHANEEVTRLHYMREFAAGLADDFGGNSFTGSNRAFTLDDGTTTLLGNNISNNGAADGIFCQALNGYFELTFVGTGLDIMIYEDATSTADTTQVIINNTNVGNLDTLSVNGRTRTHKVVSGLPYGTHVVKFNRSTTGSNQRVFTGFTVYGPKKPTLPAGAFELADYNVMANFVANATAGSETIATGVLRKSAMREHQYSGSSLSLNLSPGSGTGGSVAGYRVLSAAAANTMRLVFFGTGVDLRLSTPVAVNTFTVQIDGTNPTAAGATATGFYGQWTSFVAGTGVATSNGSGAFAGGLWLSGLPLGLHTLTLTQNGASSFGIEATDIITPIHSPRNNIPYEQLSTLMVGSQGISDNRKLSAIKDLNLQVKNVAQAFGITNAPSTSATSPVPIPDMSVTHFNRSGRLRITYNITARQQAGALSSQVVYRIVVDGVALPVVSVVNSIGANGAVATSETQYVNVAPGTHKIDVYWSISSNTVVCEGVQRSLLVEET